MPDRFNALKIQPPPEARTNMLAGPPQSDWAGATDENIRLYNDFLARDRQNQIAMGYVDPQTGALTPAGWRAQAEILGGGFGPADVGIAGGMLGAIKTYHGSPHLFPPTARNPLGEFDLAKIGTGEGNQSFGKGAYVAEAERVAREGYRDPLARKMNQRPVTVDTGGPFGTVEMLEHDPTRPGHVYEVNLNAEPDQFLHWDKRISEQSPQVQQKLADLGITPPAASYTVRPVEGGHTVDFTDGGNQWNVGRVYKSAEEAEKQAALTLQMMNRNPTGRELIEQNPGIEPKLREAGIPGVRYLDRGSRGRDPNAPDATHNYAVWTPEIMEIIRRYGIAGLMAGGAATAFGGQDQGNQ